VQLSVKSISANALDLVALEALARMGLKEKETASGKL